MYGNLVVGSGIGTRTLGVCVILAYHNGGAVCYLVTIFPGLCDCLFLCS